MWGQEAALGGYESMGCGRVPCSVQAKLVSTAEIPTCLQCDKYAWCVGLGQLLIFWVVLEESMFLDLLKSFECHWASIIIPEKCLETSIPEWWAPTGLLQAFVWIPVRACLLSSVFSASLLPGARGSFDLGQMHGYLLFLQHPDCICCATFPDLQLP